MIPPLRTLAMVLGIASAALASIARAEYPERPLRMIVAAAAASGPDAIARVLADKLEQLLGRRVIVENRPGAAGIVAMNALRQAPADGYTLGSIHSGVITITPLAFAEAKYDIDRDFETVGLVVTSPLLLVANVQAPAKTLVETIAQARARPDDVVIGNPQRASLAHLAAELLAQRSGARFRQIPFGTSAEGVRAVMSGDIPYYIDAIPNLIPLVKSGKLRALALTADRPLPGLEGIPLAKDTIPEVTATGWVMIAVPKGTPYDAIKRLNLEINNAIGTNDAIRRFRDLGAHPIPGSVEEAKRFIRTERALWAKVIRDAGIRAE